MRIKISIVACFFLTIGAQPKHQLVRIKKYIPSIVIDMRYASKNNFLGLCVYEHAEAFLVDKATRALVLVQKELSKKGLGLKIWDAYRPLSAQWQLWKHMPDPRYVSDPRKGGRHTRGTAIDLTLIDLKTNNELPMGTDFDDFTKKAWPSCTTVDVSVQNNRALLSNVMKRYGFSPIKTEWWHFDFNGWHDYPVLDLPFEELV